MDLHRPQHTFPLWRNILSGAVFALALLAAPLAARAQTATIFGALSNFDAVNDTGQDTHGFEIQLEGLTPADIDYKFSANRYGAPTVVPYATGVYVRYTSPWDPTT